MLSDSSLYGYKVHYNPRNTACVQYLFIEQTNEPSVNMKIKLSRNSTFPDYPFLNISMASTLLLKKINVNYFPRGHNICH